MKLSVIITIGCILAVCYTSCTEEDCTPPTHASAGTSDQELCELSTTLGAAPAVNGVGGWSIVSGTGGTIANPANPTSAFTGTAGGDYILRWTVSNECGSVFDDVQITIGANPGVANAGPDQTACSTNVTLAGNAPESGSSGLWTIQSGTGGTLTNATSANATLTGVHGNTYTLRWTITNNCGSMHDDILIAINQAVAAGVDQTKAGLLTTATLAGNLPNGTTGTWSIVSGNTGSFSNANSPTSTFTALPGTYVLRWTQQNTCGSTYDDVQINFTGPIVAVNKSSVIFGKSLTVTGSGFSLNVQGESSIAARATGGSITAVPMLYFSNGEITFLTSVLGVGTYELIYVDKRTNAAAINYPSGVSFSITSIGSNAHTISDFSPSTLSAGQQTFITANLPEGSVTGDCTLKLLNLNATSGLTTLYDVPNLIVTLTSFPNQHSILFTVPVGTPPGDYLLKLIYKDQEPHYVHYRLTVN